MPFIKNILQGFLGLKKDSSITTQNTAVIRVEDTNTGIAIVPNGTGAITASIPDGTVVGGGSRGANAVDLQMVRDNTSQVSQGISSFIGSGERNSITSGGNHSSIVGGFNNIIYTQYGFIGGGRSNNISNEYSNISGGLSNTASSEFISIGGGRSNNASINYATISGGQSNTISTNTHATVVGGQGNVSSGQNSVSGGSQNIVSGYSSVAFGEANQATSGYAIAMGNSARATSSNAIALGVQNYATNFGAVAIGGSYANAYIPYSIATGDLISTRGDAQFTSYISRVSSTLTSGGTVILTNSGEYEQGIPLGNNRAWNVNINWVAVVTSITGTATGVTVGDTIAQCLVLGFKRVGGTSSIVGSSGALFTNSDASMLSALLTPTAGASQELALTFTAPSFGGGGSITCRIVAKVELVEVAY